MRFLLAVLLALVLAAPAAADVEYTVTDLSAAGLPTLDAWGVNDDGVVVGTMNTGAPYSGFRWTERLGLRALDGKNAIPLDVNAAGTAVGLFDRPQDTFFRTGARWDVFGALGALMPQSDPACSQGDAADDDCDGAYAHGIGPDGVAVGAATINAGAGDAHAPAYWLPSATNAIRLQNTVGVLEARNAAGMMVGLDGTRAAVWRAPGDKVVLPLLDTGDAALARDVNDAGVVVGDGATRPSRARNRAFTWTEAEGLRRLDTLGFGTEAHAISSRGEIVGMSRVTDDDAGRRAVRWVNREITDLNTLIAPGSGWTLVEAHDVNANGWIVGRGVKDGQQRAFLLKPAPALAIKLEGGGWNPFDDTFLVRATVTNVGTAAVTDLTLAQDLTPTVEPYPPDQRAIAVRLRGPEPVLPSSLEPGQTATVLWMEQADAIGYLLYNARITATARGISQAYAGSVEVHVGAPAPLTLGDVYLLLMGQWDNMSEAVRTHMAALRSNLTAYALKSLKPFRGKKAKLKPSPAERALARALHLPDDYFAPLPNDAGEGFDLVKSAYVATERGKYDALKAELGGAKDGLIAAGKFLDRWTSADGVAEMQATGSELWRMARNGEVSGGLVSESAAYWHDAAIDPARGAETERQLAGLTDDAVKAAQATYDKALVAGKKTLADSSDTFSRNPKQAVEDLFYAKSKIETKVAIEYAKSLVGDKVMKSVGLLRRMDKAADGVEEAMEAFDDERRLAQLIDESPPGVMTAAQVERFTGMTEDMNARLLSHAQALQKRYPGINLRISFRPLTKGDVAKLKAGLTPKIEAIPIKKVNNLDVAFLGADHRALDEVGYFTPKKPSAKVLKALNPSDRADVLARYESRLEESRAMAGKSVGNEPLEKKVSDLKKGLSKDGHVIEEKIGDVTRRTELHLGIEKRGNVKLFINKGVKINGRPIGKKGFGFTGDLDTETTLDGLAKIPAGAQGSVELSWQEALRSDPNLPVGHHGWGGYDLSATTANKKLVFRERLARLPNGLREAEAQRLAATHGFTVEDLLKVRRNGFVITVTARGFEVSR